ncbi:hypothetical protein ACFYR1_02810 [Streptomyces canus]|uniref:hypothetical protein n=1 Tax=Streptomyces canus TaxID=58343 RepID=UPI00368AE415
MVEEAATEVIARAQARGEDEPWTRVSFVQIFDRSPVCALALATYLGRPVSRTLGAELERKVHEETYRELGYQLRPSPEPRRYIGWIKELA